MAATEEVDYYQLYKFRPLILHFYVTPFILIYLLWLYTWTMVYGVSDYFEVGVIVFVVIMIFQILAWLSCLWSVHVRCLMTCSKADNPQSATVVKVVPTPNNGYPELVKLHHSKNTGTDEEVIWFRFQKLKYIYDSEEKKVFLPVDFPINHSMEYYKTSKGYQEESEITKYATKYGKNRLEMNIPDFMELFKERATAPFFVFQVFCVGLWCMDEYWYYSLFTLFMLVSFEATLVQQQLRNMKEIRNMGSKPFHLQVYRNRKWRPILSEELLPGDICSIGRCQNQDILVPCDLLLLRGSCIVDEAMLTGESVPQMKEAIEELEESEVFDLERHSKVHLLSGGTKVVQHSAPAKTLPGLKAPDNGCVAYVLRTGFNTSQGRLLRTILFGVKRITANNLETFLFILFLLVFAISASSYVWIHGTADPRRNRYKLFLECTLILTSVVPPELPIELSLAVNSSLMALSKLGVFCTEPFRIPFAGKIDICCFDKTGTLTSDNLVVQGVAGISSEDECCPIADVPNQTLQVLASCHSLAYVDTNLVGDPLEIACLSAVDWTLTKGDIVMPKKGKKQSLRIVHRFHFASSLKRMSAIVSVQTPGSSTSSFMATVKGAPETLRSMYTSVPDNYDEVYQKMTWQGARVLALGYKILGELQAKDVRELKRGAVESELVFAGFVIISCPLKQTSKNSIKEIQYASHHTVMITGDNPLTACHVAKELKLTKKPTLVLTACSENVQETGALGEYFGINRQISRAKNAWSLNSLLHVQITRVDAQRQLRIGLFSIYTLGDEGSLRWQSLDKSVSLPLIPEGGAKKLKTDYDLCVTGEVFPTLQSEGSISRAFTKLWSYVKVYARVAPKQKEFVVTKLKSLGFITLMCGDGTNDVGALKHADVGVALLSGSPEEDPKTKNKQKKAVTTSQNKEASDEISIVPRNKVNPPSGRASSKAAKMRAVARGENTAASARSEQERKLQEMLKSLDAIETQESQVVRLGDASIASPFTSKHSSIVSVCHIVKQGRCTLVTTLQMFKILALNALILAYSQSALYLDGIKFSDGQATLQGILLAGCFLFISRSKPLKTLSKERPLPNIFNVYTILTVMCQFSVHFYSLYYLTKQAKRLTPGRTDNYIDLDTKFEANIVNSTVYLISMAMQLSTFAVNYKGHPFMESLLENKPLLYSLTAAGAAVMMLTTGTSVDFCNQFEIVPMPDKHRVLILQVMSLNFVCCWMIDRILQFFLGNAKMKST